MILYEVDFTNNKKNKNLIKLDNKPAEIIKLKDKEEDLNSYIIKACDLFNNGNLLQSAYQFNKAYAIDAKNDHSVLVDVSILGIINIKLSNFDFAQKYLLKSLSLKVVPTIVLMLYYNSLYLKNFKLARKIKKEFKNVLDFKNLCLVKNEEHLIYCETFNFKKTFAELISSINTLGTENLYSVIDILNIMDCTNPYLIQIERDLLNGVRRKYSLNYTQSLIKLRFNEIDLFLRSKVKDFNEIKMDGIVRFLFDVCKIEKFQYYLNEFYKIDNLPLNFIWQCEDALFNSDCEDKKLFIVQKLLFEKRYKSRKISFYLHEQLFILSGLEELRTLKSLNDKIANSFVSAIIEISNLKKLKQSECFIVEIEMQRIIRRLLINLKNEEFKTERISAEKFKRCFLILLANNLLNLKINFEDEIKNLGHILKKLGFDLELMKKISQQNNVILVDFN